MFFEVFECFKMEFEDEDILDWYVSVCKKLSEMIFYVVVDFK